MGDLGSRVHELLEQSRQRLPRARERADDKVGDRALRGVFRSALAALLRFVGAAEYGVHCDTATFRACLAESASIELQLCLDFAAGGAVDPSLVSPLVYKAIYAALAAGSNDTAEALAAWTPHCPTKGMARVHPFDEAMCRALASVVLRDCADAPVRIEALRRRSRVSLSACLGYCDALDGITRSNQERFERGMRRIVADHPSLTRRGRIFSLTEDALLCVWGIGVANLAATRGLHIRGLGPLIPDDLLLESGECAL